MGGGGKFMLPYDQISMSFPQTRCLGISLHGRKDWDNKTMREPGPLFMVDPPIMEGLVQSYEEALFRRWGLSKCIGDISAVNYEIFSSRYCIEDARARLVYTVGICVVQYSCLASTR